MGGPVAATEAAKEDRQIMSELNRIRDAIGENGPLVSELEQRLSDVLRDETEKEGAVPEAPEELFCPLAGMLRNVRRDIHNRNDQVRNILRRLEL